MEKVTVVKVTVHYLVTEEGFFMRDAGGNWWVDYSTAWELAGCQSEKLEALFQANKPE